MQMEQDQHDAWKSHIDQYAKCPSCGADGELEGECVIDDPEREGEPVFLKERMECPACGGWWWEVWRYHGRQVVGH